MNRFVLNETSYHGAGAINSIPEEIRGRGFKKVLVASDPDLVKFGVTKKVTDVLDNAGLAYEVYSQIKPNPTIENVCLYFKEKLQEILNAMGWIFLMIEMSETPGRTYVISMLDEQEMEQNQTVQTLTDLILDEIKHIGE